MVQKGGANAKPGTAKKQTSLQLYNNKDKSAFIGDEVRI